MNLRRRFLPCLLAFALLPLGPVSGQTVWSEDFNDPAIQGKGAFGPTNQIDMAGVTNWTIDISMASLSEDTDWFRVVSQLFEARDVDGEAVWASRTIDISAHGRVRVSMDAVENGNMEGEEYLRVYYRLNGGPEQMFETDGDNMGEFTSASPAQDGLSGTSLAVVVRIMNDGGAESHMFDNVTIGVDASDPNEPEVTIGRADGTVRNEVDTIELSGTANTNAVGRLTWRNPLVGHSGIAPAGTNWSAGIVALGVGTNTITVTVTNAAGVMADDTVSIVRLWPIRGPLRPGDIALIGYRSDNPDGMSFVSWTGIQGNTEILFTDHGWRAAGGFRQNENVVRWTCPPDGLPVGTVVVLSYPRPEGDAKITDRGTDTGELSGLSPLGDQVFAFTNSLDDPAFLFGLDFNGAPGWDADATNANESAIPVELTLPDASLAVDHSDNGQYAGPRTGPIEDLKAAVVDPRNWNFRNDGDGLGPLDSTDFLIAAGAPSRIVINEVYLNPPGTNDAVEFVELRSTSGRQQSLDRLCLLVIDSSGAVMGDVDEVWNLAGLLTGANGLALLGNNLDGPPAGGPWNPVMDPATTAAEPFGPGSSGWGDADLRDDNNFTLLLVSDFTGGQNDDLDANDDLTLDVTPWSGIVDSLGLGLTYAPGRPAPALAPDALGRLTDNDLANAGSAWYGAEILGGETSVLFNATNSYNLPVGARLTPGSGNYPAVTDSDEDGLPNGWERRHFGDIWGSSPRHDPDRDGFDNEAEYISDTDPRNPSSFFPAIPGLTEPAAGQWRLLVDPSSTARVYDVLWNTNLLDGGWQGYGLDRPGNGGPLPLIVTNGTDHRFLRTGVRVP
ncbi:hypothetical protein ACFLSJ_05240 [Verrucomicrobiota bacterium]